MKQHLYTCILQEYNYHDLLITEQRLIDASRSILKKAYAPYSNFKVGAALMLEGEEIISGNNQENAAYPSGLCAERVALFYAGAHFPDKKIIAIAIASEKNQTEPIAPCGACRQVLIEYELKQKMRIKILLTHPDDRIFISESVENILPFIFKLT